MTLLSTLVEVPANFRNGPRPDGRFSPISEVGRRDVMVRIGVEAVFLAMITSATSAFHGLSGSFCIWALLPAAFRDSAHSPKVRISRQSTTHQKHRGVRMVDIYTVDMTKDQLAAMPDDERAFLFFLGHATNEINCFSKLIIMTSNIEANHKIVDHVHTGQAFILLRVLAGKCHEAWEFFRNSKVAARYRNELPDEIKAIRDRLGRELAEGGSLQGIRNITFHNPYDHQLNKAFDELPASEPWCFYLSKSIGNSFFFASELVMQRATLGYVAQKEACAADDELTRRVKVLFEALIKGSGGLQELFLAYLNILIAKRFPDANAARTIRLRGPELTEAAIPFFVERDGRT